MKHLKQILAMLLVATMLIQVLPAGVFAEGPEPPATPLQESTDFTGEDPVYENAAPKEATVLGEMPENRGETEKHFRMDDGSFIAVDYGIPVHYTEDAGANWKDIDNTLVLKEDLQIGNEKVRYYAAENGPDSHRFAQDLSSGFLFGSQNGDYGVSFYLTPPVESRDSAPEETGTEEAEAPTEMTSDETMPAETEPAEGTDPAAAASEPEAEENAAQTEPTPAETVPVDMDSTEETTPAAEENQVPTEPVAEASEPETSEPVVSETEANEPEAAEPEVSETAASETEAAMTETSEPQASEPAEQEPEAAAETTAAEAETDARVFPAAEISYPDARGTDSSPAAQNDRGEEKPRSVAEQVTPAKLRTDVLYRDVYDGVDLSYELYSRNVKESILIREPCDSYSFTFYMELSGLTPVLQKDGSIELRGPEGKLAYLIPAPYMTDANDNISDAVFYALNETESGAWELTVTADEGWINAEERTFPVAIDPTVIDRVSWTGDNVAVTAVMQGEPTTSHYHWQRVVVGYDYDSSKEARIYVGFDKLPDVPSGCEVVNASLYLAHYAHDHVTVDAIPAELHAVTATRPSSYTTNYDWIYSRTWNTKPAVSTTVEDYKILSTATVGQYCGWEITGLVRSWYTAFRDTPSGSPKPSCAASIQVTDPSIYGYNNYADARMNGYGESSGPLLIVSYRNMAGIEPYYTYQALGADRAGTGYISDATGNLTITTPLASYASGVSPFSLNLVYNSLYQSSKNGPFHVSSKLGYDFTMGWNMKLNIMQKLEKVNLQYELESSGTKTYIKYTDGDGTVHYFAKDLEKDSTGVWYFDEDGLGLKIKEDPSSPGNYRMDDDQGNVWIFTHGFLSRMTDNNGNMIKIFFLNGSDTTATNTPAATGARLNHVSIKNNGETHSSVVSFSYETVSGGYRLSGIQDSAGNEYHFTYSGNRFHKIFRKGSGESTETQIVEFSYKDATSLIRRMRDMVTDYMVNFEYDAANRVSKYYEHAGPTTGTGGEDGAAATITRVPGEKTVYTDWGNDRTEGTDDDIVTTCLFDYFGRTVNAYTATPANKLLGASNAIYTATSGTDKKNNRTLRSAGIGMASVQLLPNGGFEFTDNNLKWTMDTASGATVSAPADALPRTGHRSFKAAATASVSSVYGAHHLIGSLGVGKSYTVSAYVNTTGVTSFTGNGVYLKVTDAQGGVHQSEYLNYVTDPNIDGGWTRMDLSFQASHGGNHTVYLCLDGVIGDTYIDDLQVEYHDAPSNVNLIENGGFSFDFHGWKTQSGAALSSSDYVTNITAIQGKKALKITGNPSADKSLYQDVTVNLPGTQTYVLSGWGKANSVPDNVNENTDTAQDTNKQFGLRAVLTYSDSTTEYHYVPFNPDVTEWQFASLAIVPKAPTKTVSTIKVICAYEKNANIAYFDNLALMREVAQTMTYDTDGNLTSVKSTGTNAVTATYANNNLTHMVTDGDGTFDYTYDSKHNLTTAKNAVVKERYNYDTGGNVTSSELTKADGTGVKIVGSTEYTYDKNRVQKTTAANGAETSYVYGSYTSLMYAIPTKVTNAAGTETWTTYNKDGSANLSYISSCIALTRTYDAKNRLTKIKRGGYYGTGGSEIAQYYNFAYDDFGNTTSISVGSSSPYVLGSYTYAPKDGPLTQMTYGNGATVSYSYDSLGRKTQTTTSSGDSYSYRYTGDGQLYEMTDTAGGLTYRYLYDTLGRLIGSSMKSGDSVALQTWHQYNENNKLSRQDWVMPGASYYTQYGYDSSGRLASQNHVLPTGNTAQSLDYDNLSRVSRMTTTKYYRDYQYKAGADSGTTTGMVSKLTLTSRNTESGFGVKTFNYTYDILGNITKIVGNGDTWTYTYDNQSQLTKAVSNLKGTWNYSYDTTGNIRSKTHGNDSISYTYGNSKWKDLLTAVSGTKSGASFSGFYTYDGGGNPTSYYNVGDLASWTMTWKNGRELATASKTGTSISYDYDVNGLRTQKTVNGITHTYTYASGQLLRDAWTEGGVSYKLDFFYDPNGHAYVIFYQKGNSRARFYCLTNLQGDVIGLLNTSSQLVAEYSYDAYGNLLTKTNYGASGLASEICDLNPLRYRGYYFDQETGWYYLQSRYYDPALGRFLNADSYASTGQGFLGYNMFAYCGNGPVSYRDCDGNSIQPLTVVCMDSPTYKTPSIVSGKSCSSYSEPEWKGYDDTRIVGAGIQVSGAFSVDNTTVCGGVEVIVFWDTPEAIESGGPIVQCFVFAGGSADISGIMDSLEIDQITSYLVSNSSQIMQNPTQALGDYINTHKTGSVSVSGVLVYGEKDFVIDNYSGAFITSSFTALHFTTSWSEGTNCHAISFGYVWATTPGIGVSGSCTYYFPL